VTRWLICGVVAVVLGLATWGLARASSREMPSYTGQIEPKRAVQPPTTPTWQFDPSRFGRCPGCRTLRPLDGGLIADHNYPEASVPFDQQSFPCAGTGFPPKDTGDRDPDPRTGLPVAGQELRGDAPTSGGG
jgi:hypothetical protein